jgi:predicted ATPase/DNA-binding CsgD family transcriptional regulator
VGHIVWIDDSRFDWHDLPAYAASIVARPRRRLGNLPAEATSFVGRRHELAEIRRKLTTARLVSLVGPGGVGKTRLAIRAATGLGRGFADGAWLVELADIRDPALVTNAVVAALDLRDQAATPRQVLIAHLRDRQLLLVVDNCEHVLQPAAELVATILRSSPELKVVTTSREPLQVSGEYVVPVPPLQLPEADASVPLAQLRQNEAVALFAERAAAAAGTFELTARNQVPVVQLCRRLDGLPLAIELAAVRTRTLSVEDIVGRLNDRFVLLTGGGREALPRHQTLQATIDWSYDLLTADEQTLLRRLCVFGGVLSADDARSVCASNDRFAGQVPDLLASLVEKSLVMREDVDGRAGYRLHETMREYASDRLQGANEADLLEARCLEHYRTRCLATAEEARYHLLEWLAWTDVEIDNIRAVLQRCITHGDHAAGLDIAASLGYFWITRATTEGFRWLDQLDPADQASSQTRIRADDFRGWLSLLQGDPLGARRWAARALTTARGAGSGAALARSLSLAATAEDASGDPAAAARFIDETRVLLQQLDDDLATIDLLQAGAIHALFTGATQDARALSLEGARLSQEAGDVYQLEAFLRNLTNVAMLDGDLDAAKARTVEALRLARDLDHRAAEYYGLSALGWHAAITRQPRLAARLLGAAEMVGIGAGADIMGPFAPYLDQAKASAMAELGTARFEAEFSGGRGMSREAALRLALGERAQTEVEEPGAVGGPLAKRELDVAHLIAEGLSNKQISARLFISEPTVATHIRNIMNKLGYNSRAQIAGWVASGSR